MAETPASTFADQLWEQVGDRIVSDPELMQTDAFLRVVTEPLIEDDGTLEDMQPCFYRMPTGRPMEVAGYAVNDNGRMLDIATVEHGQRGATVSQDRVLRKFRQALRFVDRARAGLHRVLEEASPPHDMAHRIYTAWPDLEKIRIFLLTDGRATIDQLPAATCDGVPVAYELWDITRIQRLMAAGVRQEEIDVDLTTYGQPVLCLPAPDNTDSYQCLMALVPGQLLAELYEEHGTRLLQRNVRAYLQNRNKVNRGINSTVRNEPSRFLAYNNGISATASDATVVVGADGVNRLTRLVALQIVNGGQTTAGLHHAWKRDGADLAQILVPAKITVVDPKQLDELVPKISRYANSQNVIREADFEANSPFHVELERLSRAIWTPAAEGSTRQIRWYYERVRGQYEVDANREGSPSRRRAFKELNRRFGKTDAAKYDLTYLGQPHVVSLGAEKCFQRWTQDIVSEADGLPDAAHFKHLVAKAILFTNARSILYRRQLGGYLGQTTAYVVALLVQRAGDDLDLDRLWREQRLDARITEAVSDLCDVVRPVLLEAPGSANITEWCKKEQCWKLVQNVAWKV